MARKKRLSKSGDELPLFEVYLYNSDAKAGLELLFLQAHNDERFALMTNEEIQHLRRKRLDELELQSILSLMTSLEAIFQLDYHHRVEKRLKDKLSRYFRDNPSKSGRVSFENDIIKGWEEVYPEIRRPFQPIKRALKYRHWLAHGRYWLIDKPKENFIDFYELAEALQNTIHRLATYWAGDK